MLAGNVLRNTTIIDSGFFRTLAGHVLKNATIVDSGVFRTLAGHVLKNMKIADSFFFSFFFFFFFFCFFFCLRWGWGCDYGRLSSSRSPRDSLKYFEISIPQHIRIKKKNKLINHI